MCDYTPFYQPSQPDRLSGDCIAVVHGLGLRLVIKAMVARWLQGLFGWGQQQAWVYQAKVVNPAGLQRMRAVVAEFAWQPLAPAALDQPRYIHRR